MSLDLDYDFDEYVFNREIELAINQHDYDRGEIILMIDHIYCNPELGVIQQVIPMLFPDN